MSFTRLPYDTCSYVYDMDQSIKVGEYNLNTPTSKEQFFVSNPSVPLNKYGASVCEKDIIDVDSELMGLNVKQTKCPSKQFKPSKKPFCKLMHMKEQDFISPEETRLSNPPCTLRGTGWNRWEWLCENPQDKAIQTFETNINNRLIVKDNHRPCLPKPIDNQLSLPPENNSYPLPDWSTYKDASYPIVHWRCCGEINKL
jgi:hypothetical protein